MKQHNEQTDPLRNLFGQLPEEQLPASFRSTMMQQIMAESARIKNRNKRLTWIAICIASLFMIALGVLVLLSLDIPKIVVEMPSLSSVSFYLYIGALSLLLLFVDYMFRKKYRKRQSD